MSEAATGGPPPPRLPAVDPTRAGPVAADILSPELLAGFLVDGDDELAAWVLRNGLATTPRPRVFDDLLRPAMQLVGHGWEAGRWNVADEHLASQTLIRAMDRLRPESGPETRVAPLAVLAAVAGEHHMIGLVCLDHVLREANWNVANLGADVPPADLGRLVARHEAVLVALTASHPARVPAVVEAVAAARAARDGGRGPVVILGGRLAEQPGTVAAIDLDWVGASLVEADRYVRDLATRLGRG